MTSTFEVLPASAASPDEIVTALSDAFDRAHTIDWFRWKHQEGPWGPSSGWIARDDDGVVGVRLFTPWRLRFGTDAFVGSRAMDGGTVPRARRQGIFEALVRAEMSARRTSGDGLLLSTAVPASRAAYAKCGWQTLGSISRAVRIARRPLRRAALRVGAELLDALPSAAVHSEVIATDWDARALRWRIDPRSGHRYEVAALANASGAQGIVYRVVGTHRWRRQLVIEHCWGSPRDVCPLVAAVAAHTRSPLVVEPIGSGSAGCGRQPAGASTPGSRAGCGTLGPGIRRGESVLCSWSTGDRLATWPTRQLARWELWLADLEGVL